MTDDGCRRKGEKWTKKTCTLRGFKIPLCILITKFSWYQLNIATSRMQNYTGRFSNLSPPVLVGKCFWLVGFSFFKFFRCLCSSFFFFFFFFNPVPTIVVVVPFELL